MKLIVVTTKQGETYRGRRRFTLRPVVKLDNAEALLHAAVVEPLKGFVEIPAANVAFIQRLPESRERPQATKPNPGAA